MNTSQDNADLEEFLPEEYRSKRYVEDEYIPVKKKPREISEERRILIELGRLRF